MRRFISLDMLLLIQSVFIIRLYALFVLCTFWGSVFLPSQLKIRIFFYNIKYLLFLADSILNVVPFALWGRGRNIRLNISINRCNRPVFFNRCFCRILFIRNGNVIICTEFISLLSLTAFYGLCRSNRLRIMFRMYFCLVVE